MNKYKLHQWLTLLFTLVMFTACSKRNYPDNNAETQGKYENPLAITTPAVNMPEAVINIPDELAKINKEGEMYYDNADGYRYWKSSEGKYYLDAKYGYGAKPDKRVVKKAIKKKTTKHQGKMEETDFAHQ